MLSIYHLSHSVRITSFIPGGCCHFGRQLFWPARAEPSLGKRLCNKTYQTAKWSLKPVLQGPRKLSGKCFRKTECHLGSTDDTFKPIGNSLRQGCGAVKFFDGSGSDSGSGKAFRLRLRLQAKHFEGSGSSSGQKVPAPAPHILNTDPLKSIEFDPLQKK